MKIFVLSIVLVACGSKATNTNVVNGCNESDYKSGTTIGFGGDSGSSAFTYEPRCLKIAKGTKVSFKGDFSMHPLNPGVADGQTGTASASNPIPNKTNGTTTDVTFSASGDFPYFCGAHFNNGMFGSVRVE